MTPTRRQQWVRAALKATFESPGELAQKIDTLALAVEKLPSVEDRKRIASSLKRGLRSRLRTKRALICTGAPLEDQLTDKLEALAKAHGAEFVETKLDRKLLAGFQLQLGDDRTDATLLKNLQKF